MTSNNNNTKCGFISTWVRSDKSVYWILVWKLNSLNWSCFFFFIVIKASNFSGFAHWKDIAFCYLFIVRSMRLLCESFRICNCFVFFSLVFHFSRSNTVTFDLANSKKAYAENSIGIIVLRNKHIWYRIAHGMRSSGNPQSRHDELICVSHTTYCKRVRVFCPLFFSCKE